MMPQQTICMIRRNAPPRACQNKKIVNSISNTFSAIPPYLREDILIIDTLTTKLYLKNLYRDNIYQGCYWVPCEYNLSLLRRDGSWCIGPTLVRGRKYISKLSNVREMEYTSRLPNNFLIYYHNNECYLI